MEIDADPWSEDEPVVYIPFASQARNIPGAKTPMSFPSSSNTREVPYGSTERYKLYQEVWTKCENQIIGAARKLCAPALDTIMNLIDSSEADINCALVQKMLSTPEMPSALVVGEDRQEFFDDLTEKISQSTELLSSKLAPEHFSNLQVALKTLIEGFIGTDDERKRRPSMSLATYDIQLLHSWYTWKSSGSRGQKLVILIQDFESCSLTTAHDLFHICSKYMDQLPFTFILGASSSDVMNTTFSRVTRSLLSVRKVHLPDGQQRFEYLTQKLFFDVNESPSLMLSGRTLSWLIHSWSSYHGSLDAVLSHLQLVYLRHFQNPLTFLWKGVPTSLAKELETPNTIDDAPTRQFIEKIKTLVQEDSIGRGKSKLSTSLNSAISSFHHSVQSAKLYFLILVDIQKYLRQLSSQPTLELTANFVRLMELFGDGRLEDTCEKLLKRVRLLNRAQLLALFERLLEFSNQSIENEAVSDVFDRLKDLHSKLQLSDPTEEEKRNKHPVSDELATILETKLWPTMNAWAMLPLSEVWRTADREPPLDILNPSFRSNIISTLTQPGTYLLHDLSRYVKLPAKGKSKQSKASQDIGSSNVMDPDICIIFDRYVNAGKTINVYDWFESFAQGLESSRPAKKSKVSKQTAKEDETWRRETYGRFMWSLHELDMLGFLRWTGRGTGKKGAECAGKSVWVIADPE